MQIIPVFDIKEGTLVHAIGGMRESYRPLQTDLLPSPDPERACATLVGLGFRRFYIADLDAITKRGNNFELVRDLVGKYSIEVWLDPGLTGPEEIPLQDVRMVSLVAGTETLAGLSSLSRICQHIGASRVVFSLDTVNGKVLSSAPDLRGADPADLVEEVLRCGIKDVIVLDLRAIGSRAGINDELINGLARRISVSHIFPGGGLTPDQINKLKKMSIPGVLTATALYSRKIAALPEL